jgi:23S rRNA U2552 (ribose-2'-O)-methylase RlmE/FtsJ
METEKTNTNNYNHEVYELPDVNEILNSKADIIESNNHPQPLFKYGFHYYIHQTKDKMSITNSEKYKRKKFYHVVNNFEHKIDNLKDNEIDICRKTLNFFDIKNNQPGILSRAFYKLWEIITNFNIIDVNNKNFVSAHLAEGPGSFIQATMFYRNKYCDKKVINNDKYHAITLYSTSSDIPDLENKFIDYYDNQKPKRFFQHVTYPTDKIKTSINKDDGDLTKIKTIKLFRKDIEKNKKFADLITADGGFPWFDENYQEQEVYRLLLGEIICALNIQNKGGHFILKIYEIFTDVTIKLLCILKSFYENVYIYKPFLSRSSNSERYIIAKNFKFKQDKVLLKKIIILENMLEKANDIEKKNYIHNIFSEYEVSEKLKEVIIYQNKILSNIQHKEINNIISYINGGNYFGDLYHEYREKQINANNFWIKNYYPKKSDINKYLTHNYDDIKKIINNNNKNIKNFSNIYNKII